MGGGMATSLFPRSKLRAVLDLRIASLVARKMRMARGASAPTSLSAMSSKGGCAPESCAAQVSGEGWGAGAPQQSQHNGFKEGAVPESCVASLRGRSGAGSRGVWLR